MSKVNDIQDGWVVREEEIFGDFFCNTDGVGTYGLIRAKGAGISRIEATTRGSRK